jgi:exopolysaccharide biosynthesis polyprenyl glycosylphosphotransferase
MTIPRRFFWFFDFVILISALFLVAPISYTLHRILALTGYRANTPGILPASPTPVIEQVWILLVAALPIIIILDTVGRGNWLSQSRSKIIFTGAGTALLGVSLVTLVIFALRSSSIESSRLHLLSFGIASALGLSSYRLAVRQYHKKLKKADYYIQNVLLIGLPSAIAWMTHYFEENINPNEYRIFGSLDVQNDGNPSLSLIEQWKDCPEPSNPTAVLGHVSQLGKLLINTPIDEVIAVSPTGDGMWLSQVIRDCDNLGILLRIVPESLILGHTTHLRTLFAHQALHLPAVVLSPPHLDTDALFMKRVFDILISSFLLVILSPLFALIALLIKLTTPDLKIIYPWHVVGRNGVRFTGYKFATMAADADQKKALLAQLNEMSGPVFKIKNDPRITPLGRYLRKFDLNELPQLWSVLKGDMSLVGPRPAGPHELERYEFWHKRRLSIRPGITCLWQVRGRNRISSFDDWVRMDLEYIDNWSLWLDTKILIRTFFVVLSGTGS